MLSAVIGSFLKTSRLLVEVLVSYVTIAYLIPFARSCLAQKFINYTNEHFFETLI
jgi:hypothetical protein